MRLIAAALIGALAVTQGTAPPDLTRRLDGELARVRQDLEIVSADQQPALKTRADRAAQALQAGRAWLALYEIEPVWEGAATARFIRTTGKIQSADDFAALWRREGEPRPGASRTDLPLAVEALAEAADARGPATYRAALPFAQDAGLEAGVYYLGDARSSVAFAAFARGLPWPTPSSVTPVRSIAGEIEAFDRTVTAAYERMDRAQHPGYIQTSVAIKQARTLDTSQQHAGALFEYLMAQLRFALLGGEGDAATGERIDAARAALLPQRDNSLAELFLQMADAALASPDAAAHKTAAAILNRVLPAYLAATAAPTLTEAAPASEAHTTITLVRWPFT